ncbi:hypothetical protein OS188_05560 [Xanthomarina sp. F1114]|uniref:hypothetical protein n=1 Tax=unclassified Xanthomarina TaxID=2649071 RepID=UPI00225E354B|nr:MULTISPECIES: hypothetical protein [unclassified Xanthomarina]MCX7547419.1 hypothetical protein [Xanthomarina sp. F1114]MCX7549827.1 hypothetical protein [Xanthomarina sp. F2636L]
MLDFIYNYGSQLNDLILVVCAVIGIMFYKKYRNYNSKIFIYYLVYVALVDFIGSYPSYVIEIEELHGLGNYLKGTYFSRNFWWFTIFWNIGSVLFMSYYYYVILKNRTFKKIVKYICLIFLASSIIYISQNVDAFFNSLLKFVNIFGALVILNCISLYFIEILNSDKILVFYKSLNSIVSITMFLWWLIITTLLFYEAYFSAYDIGYLNLRSNVYLFSNLFMYSTFSLALILCDPEQEI